eukprot:953931-Pelagomonas_calceolata.AAC.1
MHDPAVRCSACAMCMFLQNQTPAISSRVGLQHATQITSCLFYSMCCAGHIQQKKVCPGHRASWRLGVVPVSASSAGQHCAQAQHQPI